MKSISEIWIVDDNEVNNFICESLINVALPEVKVTCFTEAQNALENLGTAPNADNRIMLVDVNMPIMNGWQFLDGYRAMSEQIQQSNVIYMLTSSIAKYDLEIAENYTFLQGFMSKPLTKDLILKMYAEQTQQ